jgi:excisionase family DNA binding protein
VPGRARAVIEGVKAKPEPALDLREVMNIRQASVYLGISPDTLYKYLSEARLPAFKLGNRWRFKKTMLDRWMEQQSEHGTSRGRRGPAPARRVAG